MVHNPIPVVEAEYLEEEIWEDKILGAVASLEVAAVKIFLKNLLKRNKALWEEEVVADSLEEAEAEIWVNLKEFLEEVEEDQEESLEEVKTLLEEEECLECLAEVKVRIA